MNIYPKSWKEGVMVSLFKKGDKAEPGKYRGKPLLSIVEKAFCKVLNDTVGTMLEKGKQFSEG